MSNPICILSFDHAADPSIVNLTLPATNNVGIKATLYVQSNLINSKPWRSTTSHLNSLYEAGWDLGSHTVSHARLTDVSAGDLELEARDSFNFLRENSFIRGSRHFSYPQGAYDLNVINELKKYYDTARAVTGRVGKLFPEKDEWYKLDCFSMKANDPPTKAIAAIDEAIDKNGVAHIMFETIFQENPPTQGYLYSSFLDIINHIAFSRDSNLLTSMTVSEFYQSRITMDKLP